jgi:hypothetical protein
MEEKKKQRSPEEQAKIERMLEGLRKKREADKLAKEQKKKEKEAPKPTEPVAPVAPPNSLIETPLVSTKSKEEKAERWNKLYNKLDEIEQSVKANKKTKAKKIIVEEESSSEEEVVIIKKNKPKPREPEVAQYIEKPVIRPAIAKINPEPIVGSSEWLRKQLFGQ